jgi:ABC-type uncharacterized transport system involved in gliding motility auxiliary subunit
MMSGGNNSWDRRRVGIGALIVAAIFFLALHIFSTESLRNMTLDLTEDKIYTLSDGTKEVLAAIREPITLRLFISDDLIEQSPGLKDYAKSVQELLERYVVLSNNRIKLELIRPEPFSPEEDRAVGFGLHGVPVTQAGNLGYFGLAGTNTTDDLDVIAFISPQRDRFLEYDLSRLVQNLANPKKKKVGLVSSLPMIADPVQRYRPWQVIEQLRQFFDVQRITLEDPVPEDIDVLMVVHPRDMDDTDMYYIDQHVMRGGKTMIFVDPFSETATRGNAMQRQPPDTGSDLKKLFEAWGIDYDKNKVLGDRKGAQRVSAGRDALGRPVITDYIAWVTMSGNQIKRDDVVTGELEKINVATSGFFSKAEGANYDLDPLLSSSPEAMAIKVSQVNKDPEPAQLLKDFKATGKPFVVGARISGMFKSAFPDGPPKDKIRDEIREARIKREEDVAAVQTHHKESVKRANMIVVADTDMLADSFWVRVQDFFGQRVPVPIANNADLLSNAVDNMAGTSSLIGLRSRGVTNRPFHTVDAMKRDAELQYRAKEQGLLEKLKEIEGKLKDLQTKETAAGKTVILSAEQQTAIENFRREAISLRKELRAVQLSLRQDIDQLDGLLKAINVGLVPALVVIFAIVLGLIRRGRARRHRFADARAH